MTKRGNPNWKPGVSGNPKGRPTNPAIVILDQAIKAVQKRRGRKPTLVEHFVEQAFKDNRLLIAIMKKKIPDLAKAQMVTNDEGQILIRVSPSSYKSMATKTKPK